MKRNEIYAFILLTFMFLYVATNHTRVNEVVREQKGIILQLESIQGKLLGAATKDEIRAILDEVDGINKEVESYKDKSDELYMSYHSLDEILKQMFGKSQESYMGR